jgi:hypothetical protein
MLKKNNSIMLAVAAATLPLIATRPCLAGETQSSSMSSGMSGSTASTSNQAEAGNENGNNSSTSNGSRATSSNGSQASTSNASEGNPGGTRSLFTPVPNAPTSSKGRDPANRGVKTYAPKTRAAHPKIQLWNQK